MKHDTDGESRRLPQRTERDQGKFGEKLSKRQRHRRKEPWDNMFKTFWLQQFVDEQGPKSTLLDLLPVRVLPRTRYHLSGKGRQKGSDCDARWDLQCMQRTTVFLIFLHRSRTWLKTSRLVFSLSHRVESCQYLFVVRGQSSQITSRYRSLSCVFPSLRKLSIFNQVFFFSPNERVCVALVVVWELVQVRFFRQGLSMVCSA